MNEINKIYFCILLLKIFIRLGIIYIIYLEILSFTKSSEYRNAFAWCAHLMRSQKCQQLCVTLFWLSWFHLNEKKKNRLLFDFQTFKLWMNGCDTFWRGSSGIFSEYSTLQSSVKRPLFDSFTQKTMKTVVNHIIAYYLRQIVSANAINMNPWMHITNILWRNVIYKTKKKKPNSIKGMSMTRWDCIESL